MEITKQTNSNECGICAITSLVKHFYTYADKNQILNQANLTENGLSIFNFELLAQRFGLLVDTYQMEWSEFLEYRTKQYMVLMIKKQSSLHYVIVKKHQKYLEVFDSDLGRYQTSYKQFGELFVGVVMMIYKSRIKPTIKVGEKFNFFKNINIRYLCLNLFLQAVVICLTTLGANYLNIVINNAIGVQSISNVLVISLIFVFIYLGNSLIKYLLRIYSNSYFRCNFRFLSATLLEALEHKKKSFFNKVDGNYFYMIDTAMQSIVNFLVNEVTVVCANIILVIVTLVTITSFNLWFLLIASISMILACVFVIVQYAFQKNMIDLAIKNQNMNSEITRNFISFLKNQSNYIESQCLNDGLQTNYHEFLKIYGQKIKFDAGYDFFDNIFQNLIFIIIVILSTYLMINRNVLNIGQLTFLISLLGLLNNGINGICNFIIRRIEFIKMSDIFQKFINIDNIEARGIVEIENIKNVHYVFKKRKYKIRNGCNIKDSQRLIIDLISRQAENKDYKVYINDHNIETIKTNSLHTKLFFIDSTTKISSEWIVKHFNPSDAIQVAMLKEFKLNLTSMLNLDIYGQTLFNIFSALMVKDKIIFLDGCLRFLNRQHKKIIKAHVLPHLRKHNFLIMANNS